MMDTVVQQNNAQWKWGEGANKNVTSNTACLVSFIHNSKYIKVDIIVHIA